MIPAHPSFPAAVRRAIIAVQTRRTWGSDAMEEKKPKLEVQSFKDVEAIDAWLQAGGEESVLHQFVEDPGNLRHPAHPVKDMVPEGRSTPRRRNA